MITIQQSSILIVDDTPNNIRVLLEVLQEVNFKVAVVKSGEMALEKVAIIQPDLILLDVMMPGIDGFETCRRLKADSIFQDIPVIFMTALSDTVDKVKGLQLGAVDYITKPIQIEEVLARVNTHLTLRNTQLKLMQEIAERKQTEVNLQQTLKKLQSTQTQLIQTEKMSSLGQLVAGVAHEINNPVNFIYGNVNHANGYIQDLLSLIQLYQQHYPTPQAEIKDFTEDIELDFLITDLPKLLSSMQIGAERIRQIVLTLRNFSRLDESEMKPVNIHEGIDSTLLILQHRLKANPDRPVITIIKEYGNLPEVECYAGQLNQVFMNIINNSIDALQEGMDIILKSGRSPTITIQSKMIESNQVAICIKDNGIGIKEENQSQLFDPFFTTKPVGAGTGLGLSISYQIIVEKHHGRLRCESKYGEGTAFWIEIPRKLQP